MESSVLLEKAGERLTSFGVEPDETALAFSVGKIEEKIRNFCSITEIPDALFYTAVDMVCGEYLNQMAALGTLDAETFPMDAAIKAIEEGDVKVTFMDNASAADKLTVFIIKLMNHEADLLRYRRLVW